LPRVALNSPRPGSSIRGASYSARRRPIQIAQKEGFVFDLKRSQRDVEKARAALLTEWIREIATAERERFIDTTQMKAPFSGYIAFRHPTPELAHRGNADPRLVCRAGLHRPNSDAAGGVGSTCVRWTAGSAISGTSGSAQYSNGTLYSCRAAAIRGMVRRSRSSSGDYRRRWWRV
jgi:hypothetical protein